MASGVTNPTPVTTTLLVKSGLLEKSGYFLAVLFSM